MEALRAENTEEKQYTPKEIREMLGIDNSQIQALCRFADIKLKKNARGLTYFTNDDVKTLKDVSNGRMKPAVPMLKPEEKQEADSITAAAAMQLADAIKNLEKIVTQKVSDVLDEKLDGMDDVVMELIRVKSENETMRYQINELNKENYKLKKEINSFRKAPFGFYTKTSSETNVF